MIAFLAGLIPAALSGWLKKVLLIGGISFFVIAGAYFKGRADCSEIHAAKSALAEIQRLNQILRNTEEVAAKDRLRAEAAQKQISDLETMIGTLDAHSKTLGNSCLDADTVNRMRGLWRKQNR